MFSKEVWQLHPADYGEASNDFNGPGRELSVSSRVQFSPVIFWTRIGPVHDSLRLLWTEYLIRYKMGKFRPFLDHDVVSFGADPLCWVLGLDSQ